MALQFTTSYLSDSQSLLRHYKRLADGAIAQVTDEELQRALDEDGNSIAVIMKHLAGNMRSRWTDFLTTDGEKPDRDRDSEFEEPPGTRAELLAMWENCWSILFDALGPLTEKDMAREVRIRGERHSVMQAISRQLAHYAYHIGQMIVIARAFRGAAWNNLSVPAKQSAAYNRKVSSGEASQR